MADEVNLKLQAREAILKQIAKAAPTASASSLERLAEAYAWVTYPNQSHGGTGATS